jgi:hypothetical protein
MVDALLRHKEGPRSKDARVLLLRSDIEQKVREDIGLSDIILVLICYMNVSTVGQET